MNNGVRYTISVLIFYALSCVVRIFDSCYLYNKTIINLIMNFLHLLLFIVCFYICVLDPTTLISRSGS